MIQSVRAGRDARDFENALCAYDCHRRSASEATEAAKQLDVEAFRRPARRARDGADHAHRFHRHELDLDRDRLMIEGLHEQGLPNIEGRRIERRAVDTRRDRAPAREPGESLRGNHVVACGKTGDSKRSGLVCIRGSGAWGKTLRAVGSLSDVLGRKRLNLCPCHRYVMFIDNRADDDRGAFRRLRHG